MSLNLTCGSLARLLLTLNAVYANVEKSSNLLHSFLLGTTLKQQKIHSLGFLTVPNQEGNVDERENS